MTSVPWTIERNVNFLGVRTIADFRLRTYSIAVAGREHLVESSLIQLAPLISALGSEAYSDEFEYHRTGFAVANVGRRGVTLLLYHFGAWVDTPELFHLSWYRYEGEADFALLDRAEPIACYADSVVMLSELTLWRELGRAQLDARGSINYDELYGQYLAADAPA